MTKAFRYVLIRPLIYSMSRLPHLSVCVLVEGVMVDPEDIPVYAYHEGDGGIIETNVGDLNSLVRAIGGISSTTHLSLLIDSPGGLDKARLPISGAMLRVEREGGTVWAFNRERAESNAAWLFCHAPNRVGIQKSETMLHQAFFVKRESHCDGAAGQGPRLSREPLGLAAHPVVFRTRLLQWLETIPQPKAREEALAKAHRVFEGPNALDDFWMTAEELDSWGMMQAVVPDEEALQRKFLEACPFPEDLLPPSVRSFFGCD